MPGGLWLTSIEFDISPGSEPRTSVGTPIRPVAHRPAVSTAWAWGCLNGQALRRLHDLAAQHPPPALVAVLGGSGWHRPARAARRATSLFPRCVSLFCLALLAGNNSCDVAGSPGHGWRGQLPAASFGAGSSTGPISRKISLGSEGRHRGQVAHGRLVERRQGRPF